MAVVVDPSALAAYLQRTVSGRTAAVVNEVVTGWLTTATGTVLPEPLPADLFAWALELAAIAYAQQTPTSAADLPNPTTWDASRLPSILAAVRGRYNTTTAGPLYSFPDWDWSWTSDTTATTA